MLSKVKTLEGYKRDTSRQVLLSMRVFVSVNREDQNITVNFTKRKIENSPSLNSHKPVSRQLEGDYYGYYGWPVYEEGPHSWGASPYMARDREKWKGSCPGKKVWDMLLGRWGGDPRSEFHLRSPQPVRFPCLSGDDPSPDLPPRQSRQHPCPRLQGRGRDSHALRYDPLNDLDRFHFVMDAIDRLPHTDDMGIYLKQQLKDKLIEHKQYIDKNGEDLPEIRNWKWSNSH
jgi:hypothetical protein